MGNCPIHGVPYKLKKGNNKISGIPFEFWSCGMKNQDGTWCKSRPQLNNAGTSTPTSVVPQPPSKTIDKDSMITRLALAKSFIESGKSWNEDVKFEIESWLAWVEKRSLLEKKLPTIQLEQESSSDYSDVPF